MDYLRLHPQKEIDAVGMTWLCWEVKLQGVTRKFFPAIGLLASSGPIVIRGAQGTHT